MKSRKALFHPSIPGQYGELQATQTFGQVCDGHSWSTRNNKETLKLASSFALLKRVSEGSATELDWLQLAELTLDVVKYIWESTPLRVTQITQEQYLHKSRHKSKKKKQND